MTTLTRSLAVCAFCSLVTFGQTIPMPLPSRVPRVGSNPAKEKALRAAQAAVQRAQDEVDKLTGAASRGAPVNNAALAKAEVELQKAKDNVEKVRAEANKAPGSGCWLLPTLPHCVDATQTSLQAAAKAGTYDRLR